MLYISVFHYSFAFCIKKKKTIAQRTDSSRDGLTQGQLDVKSVPINKHQLDTIRSPGLNNGKFLHGANFPMVTPNAKIKF